MGTYCFCLLFILLKVSQKGQRMESIQKGSGLGGELNYNVLVTQNNRWVSETFKDMTPTFRWLCFWITMMQCSFLEGFFQVTPWLDDFELIYLPVLCDFVQMLAVKERHMRQRKPPQLPLRHPAPILKPNPMRSHSACSSREFCMTCAAPRDKGRIGRCCPHGEAAGVGVEG